MQMMRRDSETARRTRGFPPQPMTRDNTVRGIPSLQARMSLDTTHGRRRHSSL